MSSTGRTESHPPSLDGLRACSHHILNGARQRRRVLNDTHPLRRYSPSRDPLEQHQKQQQRHPSANVRRSKLAQGAQASSGPSLQFFDNQLGIQLGSINTSNSTAGPNQKNTDIERGLNMKMNEDSEDESDASSTDSFLRGLNMDETEEKIKQLRLQLKARRYAHRIGNSSGGNNSDSETDTLSTISSTPGLESSSSTWSNSSWSLMPRNKRNTRAGTAINYSNLDNDGGSSVGTAQSPLGALTQLRNQARGRHRGMLSANDHIDLDDDIDDSFSFLSSPEAESNDVYDLRPKSITKTNRAHKSLSPVRSRLRDSATTVKRRNRTSKVNNSSAAAKKKTKKTTTANTGSTRRKTTHGTYISASNNNMSASAKLQQQQATDRLHSRNSTTGKTVATQQKKLRKTTRNSAQTSTGRSINNISRSRRPKTGTAKAPYRNAATPPVPPHPPHPSSHHGHHHRLASVTCRSSSGAGMRASGGVGSVGAKKKKSSTGRDYGVATSSLLRAQLSKAQREARQSEQARQDIQKELIRVQKLLRSSVKQSTKFRGQLNAALAKINHLESNQYSHQSNNNLHDVENNAGGSNRKTKKTIQNPATQPRHKVVKTRTPTKQTRARVTPPRTDNRIRTTSHKTRTNLGASANDNDERSSLGMSNTSAPFGCNSSAGHDARLRHPVGRKRDDQRRTVHMRSQSPTRQTLHGRGGGTPTPVSSHSNQRYFGAHSGGRVGDGRSGDGWSKREEREMADGYDTRSVRSAPSVVRNTDPACGRAFEQYCRLRELYNEKYKQ